MEETRLTIMPALGRDIEIPGRMAESYTGDAVAALARMLREELGEPGLADALLNPGTTLELHSQDKNGAAQEKNLRGKDWSSSVVDMLKTRDARVVIGQRHEGGSR